MLGHTGHGKTTLAQRLRAEAQKHQSNLIFHDCQTYADYRTLGKKQGILAYGILVVDATVGAMPQTREHVLYASMYGIKKLIVFLNKCNLVTEDTTVLDLVEAEVTELLGEYCFEDVPILRGSALDESNVAELYGKLI